jgi:hypothetical protein
MKIEKVKKSRSLTNQISFEVEDEQGLITNIHY